MTQRDAHYIFLIEIVTKICKVWSHVCISSVQWLSHVQLLETRGLQHARPPYPSPAPEVCSNSSLSSQWCHPAISSSVVPFSSCLQSFPVSGSFPMSQFFASGGQSIGASASTSVLPMNTQNWSPLGWTGWISLLSKWLSRVVFVQKCIKEKLYKGYTISERNSIISRSWSCS